MRNEILEFIKYEDYAHRALKKCELVLCATGLSGFY